MTRPVVLVVEDNSITRKLIRIALEQAGYAVIEAPDAATALERAASGGPALVLQDLRLPDMDGYHLLARLRALPGGGELPIVAVTGFLPAREHHGTGPHDFSEVLIKPVEPSRLVRTVGALLPPRSEPGPGDQRRRVVLAEDDPVQRKLLAVQLRSWGFEVTTASDGARALAAARELAPDLIVSDLLMPEMDGLSLCLAVRQDQALARVPVVLVSSFHLDEVDSAFALRAGASAVVSRSPDLADLKTAVAAATTAAVAAPPAPAPELSVAAHVEHLVRQLERDAGSHAALAESQAISSALLAFFERFSDLAVRGLDLDRALGELLEGYLDASGASVGAAFLAGSDGRLTLRSHLGYPAAAIDDLASAFGQAELFERFLAEDRAVELPSARLGEAETQLLLRRASARSLLFAPLTVHGQPIGLLMLGSARPPASTERLRMAEAVRGPIAQAVALSRSLAELVSSRQAFRGIAESTSDGIVVADEAARVSYANPAASEIFGRPAEELVGREIHGLMPFLAPELDGGGGRGAALRDDGQTVPVAVSIKSFEPSPGHVSRTCVVRDLSLRHTLDELATLASCDGLTGLYNRRRLDEQLAARIAESVRYKFSGALVLIDLDGFKPINDTYGHQAGDAVLQAVAAALTGSVRGVDFVARLGGDEFAVDLTHIELDDAIRVAEKLLRAISVPIDWQGRSLQVGASLGIAMYPDDGTTAEQLIGAADAELYRAKRAGRNRVCAPLRQAPAREATP